MGIEPTSVYLDRLAAVTTYVGILDNRIGHSDPSRSVAVIWSGCGGIDAEVLSGGLFHRYFSIAALRLVEETVAPGCRLPAYREVESATRTVVFTLLAHAAIAQDGSLSERAIAIASGWHGGASERLSGDLMLILQNCGRT